MKNIFNEIEINEKQKHKYLVSHKINLKGNRNHRGIVIQKIDRKSREKLNRKQIIRQEINKIVRKLIKNKGKYKGEYSFRNQIYKILRCEILISPWKISSKSIKMMRK